jgi:hypothetical protein
VHGILVVEREKVHWDFLEFFIAVNLLLTLFYLVSKVARQSLFLTIQNILLPSCRIIKLFPNLTDYV